MSKEQVIQEKKDGIRSELFRFVSVRPPGRTTIPTKKRLLAYDEEKLAGTKGNLFAKLGKLGESHIDEATAQLEHVLQVFRTSAAFVDSTGIASKAWKGLQEFYTWYNGAGTEARAGAAAKLKALTGKSASDISGDAGLQSRLWDNYFFYVLDGTNPRMIQAVTELLRVYSIAAELARGERAELSGIEYAAVLLPKTVHMVMLFGRSQPEIVADAGETKQVEPVNAGLLSEEILRIEKIKKEVTDRQEMFRLPATIPDQDEERSVSDGFMSKKMWATLTKQTRTFLEAAGYGVERGSITELIDFLNYEITRRYELVFSGIKRTRRLVLIGSTLVETGEEPMSAVSSSEKRSSRERSSQRETLLSMYNSWWSTQDPAQLLDIQIGDFKRVEQETECYTAGEVAHIENILQGEHKSRETRRFTRTEEVTVSESETTEENERDVQTTDRFEMEKETSSVITTDTNVEAGLDVSASYGVVKLNATAGFSFNIATENSNRQAVDYAKSVTERALSRMVKRIKETRTSTIIKEFEDKNVHGIDNKEGDGNVVGVYRWVDKIYKVSLLNYGRRMMIKFNLLEPSSYYLYTQINNPFAEVNMPLPPDKIAELVQTDGYPPNNSMVKMYSFRDINDNNFAFWAKVYGATVNPPPSSVINVGKAIAEKLTQGPEETDRGYYKMLDHESGKIDNLVIPAGYEIKTIFARVHMEYDHHRHNDKPQANIYIGNADFWFDASYGPTSTQRNGALQSMDVTHNVFTLEYKPNEPTPLPIVFKGKNCYQFVATVTVRCSRTKEAYEAWQRETFDAIMSAYETKRAEAEYAKSRIASSIGVQIKGRNPLANKAVIEAELKKGCIESVRVYTHPWLQHYLHQVPGNFASHPANGPYVYNPLQQAVHGKYINFMEECFEWSQMTYKFHPYYWADAGRWKTLINLADPDPLFENFLKAGSSTVVVPVRPGYEKLFAYYLNTGRLWMGEDVPLTSDLNAFIDDELGDVDPNAEPELEACWNMKLPTNLVILQKQDGGLDEKGLPCFNLFEHSDNCGCE